MKTQSVSLSPRYSEQNEVQAFVATNSISATVKEIAKAGALIDAAVAAGANQVYGPSLSAGDQGSQAAQIAKDLLHLADVRILLGQDEEVANELGHLLGLTRMQQDLVTGSRLRRVLEVEDGFGD